MARTVKVSEFEYAEHHGSEVLSGLLGTEDHECRKTAGEGVI